MRPLAYIADMFSLCFTFISGLIYKYKLTILSAHTVASEVFFIVGGVLTILWLSFRALSGYYSFKKAKQEFKDLENL